MKIIQSDRDFDFKPNEIYLLSKSDNKYRMIITDNNSKPSYPFTKDFCISFTTNKDNIENDNRFKIDELTLFKPHFDLEKINNDHTFLKISDNIINAISNSYKKIEKKEDDKIFVLSTDGTAVDLTSTIKQEINKYFN